MGLAAALAWEPRPRARSHDLTHADSIHACTHTYTHRHCHAYGNARLTRRPTMNDISHRALGQITLEQKIHSGCQFNRELNVQLSNISWAELVKSNWNTGYQLYDCIFGAFMVDLFIENKHFGWNHLDCTFLMTNTHQNTMNGSQSLDLYEQTIHSSCQFNREQEVIRD